MCTLARESLENDRLADQIAERADWDVGSSGGWGPRGQAAAKARTPFKRPINFTAYGPVNRVSQPEATLMGTGVQLEDGLYGDGLSSAGMVQIPGGTFYMGSDRHYPEESTRSSHHYRTIPDQSQAGHQSPIPPVRESNRLCHGGRNHTRSKGLSGALPHMLRSGSLVFTPPRRPVDLHDLSLWWTFQFGANWRRPFGSNQPGEGLGDHPAVHIAFRDAQAYAAWAGKALPTEAEWEFAARGGLNGAEFAWDDELMPGGRHMANIWQGRFPYEELATDGYRRTSPVGAFPANGYGLFDMTGNVWEWTTDWFSPRHTADEAKPCCIPENTRGGRKTDSLDPGDPSSKIPRKVVKGGSHLCAQNYCRRYRPAARHAQPIDTGMSHEGSRCVVRS